MNIVGYPAHTHAYHVIMVTSVCVAGLSFLALVLVTVLTEYTIANQAVAPSGMWNRTKVASGLASVTGLLASLPFAFASGTPSIASIVLHEAGYALAAALCLLALAAMIARVATGKVDIGEYEPHCTGMVRQNSLFRVNPANGFPMNGSLDVAGNPYGADFHTHPRFSSTSME